MPAFGSPTRPASAISFSRSQSVRSTPSCPGLALRGAWLVEDLKRRLPQPPLPPRASSHPLPGAGQVGDQRLAVLLEDLGADRHPQHDVVGALAGALLAACRAGRSWRRNAAGSGSRSACSAPRPPRRSRRRPCRRRRRPGPPNSTNFSRRKLTQPWPPAPERIWTRAWSRNFIAALRSSSRR